MMGRLLSSPPPSPPPPPEDCAANPTREICEEATVRRCHDLDGEDEDDVEVLVGDASAEESSSSSSASCPDGSDRNCTIAFEERCRPPDPSECTVQDEGGLDGDEEREECDEGDEEEVEECHEVLLEGCTGDLLEELGDYQVRLETWKKIE